MNDRDAVLMDPILWRIKDARHHRSKLQENVANAVGLPRPSYTLVEKGEQRLTVATLLRIADYLCVPVEWLLTGYAVVAGKRQQFRRLWEFPELPEMPRPGLVSRAGGPPGLPPFSPSSAANQPARRRTASSSTPATSPASSSTPATSPATRSTPKSAPKVGTTRKQPPAKAAAKWERIRSGKK